jgi:hypothetical protein
LIQLILYLILGGIIVYVVQWIISMLTLPQPVKMAILLLVAVLVLIWLLRTAGLL